MSHNITYHITWSYYFKILMFLNIYIFSTNQDILMYEKTLKHAYETSY
jgi:hypothetical protein